MNTVKNPLLAPNKTVAVVVYFLLTLFGGSFIIIFLALFYNFIHHLNLNSLELLQIVSETDVNKIEQMHMNLYVFSNATANLIMYILLFVLVIFYMRNHLVEDAKGLIKGYKKLAWLIPLCAALGYGISYGVELGIEKMIDQTSVNQSSIVVLIKNGGAVPMFFSVVVCAPIVEELIYRKAIFEYLKKYPVTLSYVVSVIVFTLPHVVTTFMGASYTPLENLLITIPYMLSGILLCLTYHLCNKNIYASWFFHLMNNLIAFIQIITFRGTI